MQPRDLRLLDALPSSSPPALLVRDKAIVINLEFLKCIITTGGPATAFFWQPECLQQQRSMPAFRNICPLSCRHPLHKNAASRHHLDEMASQLTPLHHGADFVMIMDSGEDRVAAFVQEHRRRLKVRRLSGNISSRLARL